MSLVTVAQWIKRTFAEESAPCEHTVRRWIRTGKVPGRQFGGRWYVDQIALAAAGNPLVEKILRHESGTAQTR